MTTRSKIALANILSKVLLKALSRDQTVVRNGIRWQLDLREAIDLSIFVLGRYQPHVLNAIKSRVPASGAVVIDVGANVGAISLSLVKELPHSRVLAFEPTDWAVEKFKANMALNPGLAQRVRLFQMFLNRGDAPSPKEVYSSWDLNLPGAVHPTHGGILKTAGGATSASLDAVVENSGLDAVHFIKIDTDGYEWDVLHGATKTLGKHRPAVLFEAGYDLWEEKNLSFSDFDAFWSAAGYTVEFNGIRVSSANAEKIIPRHSTVDLLALPTT